MAGAAKPAQTPPSVRPARAGDAADVAGLLAELGYPCEIDDARERLLEIEADRDQQLCLAEIDGAVVGLLCLDLSYYLPLGAPTCRITALAVLESARRTGIGHCLLREAEQRARAAGAARIELTSASHRDGAHAFYRACGYREGALRFVKHLGVA